MAQPNDVNQILGISKDDIPRRKEIKIKDKKKRPGMIKDFLVTILKLFIFFIDLTPYLALEKVNREVFALIGDVPQMAPVEPVAQNLA